MLRFDFVVEFYVLLKLQSCCSVICSLSSRQRVFPDDCTENGEDCQNCSVTCCTKVMRSFFVSYLHHFQEKK